MTGDPVAPPTERRYAKEFIPGSMSEDGRGHWRIADGEDNRVATCWDSYNADRIVDALNEQWNRRRSVSPSPAVDSPASPSDTQRLDWLDSHAPDRCVSVSALPARGLMTGHRWTVHLNGLGYVGHSERYPANIREAIDKAMSAAPSDTGVQE